MIGLTWNERSCRIFVRVSVHVNNRCVVVDVTDVHDDGALRLRRDGAVVTGDDGDGEGGSAFAIERRKRSNDATTRVDLKLRCDVTACKR